MKFHLQNIRDLSVFSRAQTKPVEKAVHLMDCDNPQHLEESMLARL